MNENFADAPVSIGEMRAEKANSADLWTVREMLIATLREIDRGELKPDYGIVILSTERSDDKTLFDYRRVMPNAVYGLGMLTRAVNELK